MRTTKTLLLASVALGAFCASEAANAQVIIRGGGATFPSVAYRNLFDCATHQPYGASVTHPGGTSTPLSSSCASGGPSTPYLFLYVPVGSGAGKKGFVTHSAVTGNWDGKKSGDVPYTDFTYAPTWPYPSVQFAGSDDPLLASDVATYNANSGPANWGNILFIPAVIGPVAISIHPTKDGNHNAWAVAPNTIKLSRKSMCGIFSGHITAWNATSITTDNGGVVGTGPITIVHRSDGSGTTFLFTNALANQCRSQFGVNKDDGPAPSDTALTLYEFPWTDNTAPVTQCPALPFVGSNQTNWPDIASAGPPVVYVNDQCGHAVPNPTGATFVNANGNAGVATLVATTDGAIGYNTADLVQPIAGTSSPQTALLQSQYEIDNGVVAWGQAPTVTGAQTAMASASPVLDDTTRANPLNWASQGTVPNPVLPGSYPIAGFSWFLFYQCYADANVASVIPQYLHWHYGSLLASQVLGDNGMAVPPPNWVNEIGKLINTTSPIGYHGDGGTCDTKPGA